MGIVFVEAAPTSSVIIAAGHATKEWHMGLWDWIKKQTGALDDKPVPVVSAAKHPSPPKIDEAQPKGSADPTSITVGEMQTQGMPGWIANDDDVVGWTFSATLQLRTPLRVLRWDRKSVLDKSHPPPQVAKEAWEGIWLPKMKSWRDMGIDIPEFEASTRASDIGPVPQDGGDYLKLLIAVREVVEAEKSLEVRLDQLRVLLSDPRWETLIGQAQDASRIADYFFPPFLSCIDGLSAETKTMLRKQGFDTPNRIARASDEELLAIRGIGPARLKAIRERCERATENRDFDRVDAVTR